MVDHHHPVQTSAVYLCGSQRPLVPPPSPPSPLTPSVSRPASPIEELCLDNDLEPLDNFSAEDLQAKQRLLSAVHVLNTEATSLRSLTHLYETDAITADGLNAAVEAITRHKGEKGKTIFIGVGKSGHICKKLVATFNSLGIHATYLHPTEALHGDLGKIGKHDTVLFITFSGKTPELTLLLPHIDPDLPTIVLTSHTRPENCELIRQRPSMILVPAPIHESEIASFGVSAPTTSTTMALAVGDALAVVASQELHISVAALFGRNHPGGAIGASYQKPQCVRDILVPICDIPISSLQPLEKVRGADILRAGYDSATGWVRVGDLIACPSRIRRLDSLDLVKTVPEISWIGASREECITIAADTRISQAAKWIKDTQLSPEDACDEYSILSVIDREEIIGVIEAGQLLGWQD